MTYRFTVPSHSTSYHLRGFGSAESPMKLPRDGVLHVALVLPDGRFYSHSVRFSPEQWTGSGSKILDVERWLESASRDIVEQLRDDRVE